MSQEIDLTVIGKRQPRLDGAETLVLDGVTHSRRYGRDWYGGSREIVRRWWPQSLLAGENHG